jgi:AcrR family transcriptional regulator
MKYLPLGKFCLTPAAGRIIFPAVKRQRNDMRTAATRGDILAVAERCFATSGFGGTSINDVAAATRFTKPALYYHFGSKAGLFRAVLEQAQDQCFVILQKAASQSSSLDEQLTGILAGMFEFLRDRQDLTRLAFAAAFAAPKEIPKDLKHGEKRKRNFQFMQRIVSAAQKRGELDPAFSAHTLTCGIYGAMSFYLMASVLFPGTRLNKQTARQIVALYLHGAAKK